MRIQFLQNKYRNQFLGMNLHFTRPNEIQEVDEEIGILILSEHGDMFKKIENVPFNQPIEVPHQVIIDNSRSGSEENESLKHPDEDSQVLTIIQKNEPVGIMGIVKDMNSTYNRVRTIVNRLMKAEMLNQDPEKKYSIKRR